MYEELFPIFVAAYLGALSGSLGGWSSCAPTVVSVVALLSTGGPSSQYEELYCVFFTLLCKCSAKRDMRHILYYLIELDHAKRDSRLAAYGVVLLQQLEGLNL